MKSRFTEDARLGRCLWLSDGSAELAVSLDCGIRIVHFSCAGMENLFYEQGDDAPELTTPEGWRVRGGHRLWLAPEGSADYWPDNLPVAYELRENGAALRQQEDPWLRVRKSVEVTFLPDGGVRVDHTVVNTGRTARVCAPWAISSTAAGGRAFVPFRCGELTEEEQFHPARSVFLWGATSLGDRRIRFDADGLTAEQSPSDDYFKLGLLCREGRVALENRGQRMTVEFACESGAEYPDGGCNFELYLCRRMMELETLAPLTELRPGQSASHRETWRVEKIP
jgi:hypothetical protein